jgi:hypothetical protein
MKIKASLPAMTELIDFLLTLPVPPDKWKLDSRVKNKITALRPLLDSAR